MSDSLRPHGLQHARPPCPSPSPGACSNSCPSSQCCHPTISSSVTLFFYPQTFPTSGSSPKSQLFEAGGQSIGASASASVLSMKALRVDFWFDLLIVQGSLKSLFQHHNSKASFLQPSMVQVSHPYMATGKNIALTRRTFVGKVMSLHFNILSRFVLAFLTGKKCLLISWVHSLSEVILEPKKIKSVTVSTINPRNKAFFTCVS